MAENTGQLDKLIAEKVDEKIRAFVTSISNQVKEFIKDNGDYSGDYPINNIYKNIKGELELSVKDKMIATATKDLLTKVALLS